MTNQWLLIGVNAHTGNREIFDDAPTLELARALRAMWEEKGRKIYCGITVEYGNPRDYVEQMQGRYRRAT